MKCSEEPQCVKTLIWSHPNIVQITAFTIACAIILGKPFMSLCYLQKNVSYYTYFSQLGLNKKAYVRSLAFG